MSEAVENTDREIWRGPDEGNGDYYADSLHVTKDGALGINCGGSVYVKTIREWHRLAVNTIPGAAMAEPATVAADLDGGDARPNRKLDSSDRGHFHAADLVERLRNPMWAHGNIAFESPQLEQEENLAAMKEAADLIEHLSTLAQSAGNSFKAIADDCREAARTYRGRITQSLSADSVVAIYERIAGSIDRALASQPPAAPVETERHCKKCGAATNGEEAYVDGQIWCHPCADSVSPCSADTAAGDRQIAVMDALAPTEEADIDFLLDMLKNAPDPQALRDAVRSFRKQTALVSCLIETEPQDALMREGNK